MRTVGLLVKPKPKAADGKDSRDKKAENIKGKKK